MFFLKRDLTSKSKKEKERKREYEEKCRKNENGRIYLRECKIEHNNQRGGDIRMKK